MGTITIVGAGIAGPLLAYILHRNGLAVTILEADASLAARHQGGMLNLNEGTGKPALEVAGLYHHVMEHVLHGGDALLIRDRDTQVLHRDAGNGQRPEIDRGSLRRLIVEALPEGTIRWNSQVRAIERRTNGFEITLSNDTTISTDAVIGADGAWSRVRPLLTPQKPAYTGITFVELRYLSADKDHPEAAEIVGDGLMFALAKGQGIIAHREPKNELCVYAALRLPEELVRKHFTHGELVEFYRDWDAGFQAILKKSDGAPTTRPLYALPVGEFWPRTHGVTLMGDAAHLMSPFAGEGVNLAMADAADLAAAILSSPKDLDAAFASYETIMAERAIPFQVESNKNLELAFAANGPEGFIEFFQSLGES